MIDPKNIRHIALDLLSHRDHSRQDLAAKLRSRGFAEPEISAIISDCQNQGYLNESRLVENYIHHRSKKGFGPLRIAIELKTRGIPEGHIAEALEITDNSWLIIAQETWQKRFKNQQPADYRIKAKQMRFLQYRGFTDEQIHAVFETIGE